MDKSFFGLCATLLVCTGAAAQQQNDSINVQQLDEVVVSDSRFALKRENSGKTVIKIGPEVLTRGQGKSIAQIINSFSGLEISGSRGRAGSVLGVYARGGRGRQVLVVIDGARVSDPSSFSSEYDLRLLSTANVESIEIIKGAASTLYGTNAATAVINITTKKAASKKIALHLESSVGTNQTAADQNYNLSRSSNSARIGGTLNKFAYLIGVSNSYADGLSAIVTPENEKDDFSNISTDLKLGFQISEAFHIDIYGNQTKVRTQFDESFGLMDAPYEFLSKQERVGLASQFKYSKGSILLNAAHSNYDSESKSAFPGTFEARNYVVDIYNKYNFNDRFYTIVGLNHIVDRTEFAETKKFTLTDPYANMVYVSDFGLNINTGARLNSHSEYGSHFVYNVNPSFTIKTTAGYLKFLSSYATSYITPSLTQLFGNFGPNPNLKPEDDRTIEGGLEYAMNHNLRLSALYFDRKEENFVFYDNVTNGYLNAENTIDAQGVEIEVYWNPLANLRFNGNYTFTERKGDNAIRIPKHKLNASLDYRLSERTNASISYALTGERSDTDFNVFPYVDEPLESFSLVDLYLDHQLIKKRLRLFLAVSNLLNETYTEALGFTTRGRNVKMGFSLDL